MKKLLFLFTILCASLILFSQDASAADIYFSSPDETKVGENIELVVNLNTGGVFINSIELVINYDDDLLTFNGYSEDNAIVKLWIYPPRVKPSLSASSIDAEQAGKIYLSGIVPGGIAGLYDAKKEGNLDELKAIPLVRLFFTAKKAGSAHFSFGDSKILQHDGVGTPLPHGEVSKMVLIKDNPDIKKVAEIQEGNTTKKDSPDSAPYNSYIFWVISIFLLYKLLKYKYGK